MATGSVEFVVTAHALKEGVRNKGLHQIQAFLKKDLLSYAAEVNKGPSHYLSKY